MILEHFDFDYVPLRPRAKVDEEPRAAVTGDGWRAWEDRAAGRVCLTFDDLERRPAREWNLRWSVQLGAWVRLLSAGGWSAVLAAAGVETGGTTPPESETR